MNKRPLSLKILVIVLCVLFCLFAIIPIYSAFIVSLTPYSNVLQAQLVPHFFEWENYVNAIDVVGSRILNSFFYAACATVLTTCISVPAAYAIARYRFRFRKTVQFTLLLTQMMAGIVILPVLYKLFHALGMLNSTWSLVLVYTAMNLALVVTIHEGYFASLPVSIDEAAEIDGCTYLQLLTRIVFPISGPGIAVGAIFTFVNTYNEFVVPLFLLSDAEKYPLTLTVYSLITDTTIRWHVMAASSIIGIIPPVVIFTIFQKYIINGVTSGAVKG